jgi:hypothetical protein
VGNAMFVPSGGFAPTTGIYYKNIEHLPQLTIETLKMKLKKISSLRV